MWLLSCPRLSIAFRGHLTEQNRTWRNDNLGLLADENKIQYLLFLLNIKISEAMSELPAAIKHEAHMGCPHDQELAVAHE